MKTFFKIFIIAFIVVSCSKEKRPSIVGRWQLAAVYTQMSSGNFDWYESPRSVLFNLTKEGDYSIFLDMPSGHGKYIFNYSTGYLTMISELGNVTGVDYVSELNENYLTIDRKINDSVTFRERYRRAEY
jgi:hypothetical protein